MPCFKGLAVSIHTPDGPLSEFSVQRQSRQSRIACFIPVPGAKLDDQGKAQQSTFAVSITLLNPGQSVPYSTPKPTSENPNPKPQIVGGLPGKTDERGQYIGSVGPYQPLTGSLNETVAAYIYFDGRQKEEVATLLRRGEETWVNSRWVSVPDSEGGGLAEREFLFREVGLERWLNGLDLEGKDAAAKIERRRQKMEKRRLKEGSGQAGDMNMGDSASASKRSQDIMRYGDDAKSPLENLSDEGSFSSDSDDDPIPESAGQIKVALFRVIASGEVKRGEYSPQFDAHDDDDESGGQGGNGSADVDHTTSFAKPKTLDPKTISTQTVTGIDPTDKPYAVFTFMYRGERQLQKMGIFKSKSPEKETTVKRKSTDFANLPPLKPGGAVGFMNYREGDLSNKAKGKKAKKTSESDMDSDEDDEDAIAAKAEEEETNGTTHLSPDDIRRQGDLAEGVRKIKLKRQHSAEPMGDNVSSSNTPASGTTPPASNDALSTTPPHVPAATASSGAAEGISSLSEALNSEYVGSPLKKPRASVSTMDEDGLRKRLGSNLANNIGEVLGSSDTPNTESPAAGTVAGSGSHFGGSLNMSTPQTTQPPAEEEEEL
ncbi:hypothetical protein BGW36DRAFT_299428 [Talaromyces proteolyticus]|uniref:DUF7918 domain-containing protein n=1 Tax=Talaromyces proteolyticus TaxID=1131652 RepID=A0AAD4PUB9_9EURO|nr:uncharacterized protein BGW36DRAFT_299428 [Talaromyces proteolyticus]KAH8694931.1 hypothetical protein BGW36DRAFT_299428 [Talaromyces proteolyticus]